jgi:hypothetical protein
MVTLVSVCRNRFGKNVVPQKAMMRKIGENLVLVSVGVERGSG